MKHILPYLLLILALNAFSQWNSNTSINTVVAMATKSQNNIHTASDANGGIVMAWDDNRNSLTTQDDIYAQRLNASGIRKWVLYGTVICNDPAIQKNSSIIEAGNGTSIITWEDNRAGNYDIYAQKIDSLGNVLWTTNGVAICSKTTTQKSPKIVSDNAGGAIIVWEDSLNFYWDIYAQRINSSGAVLWTSGGVAICSAPNTQVNPRIDVDGNGGAIITWQDKRNNTDYDIYAQRINANGVTQWAGNGVAICNSVNTQSNPRIEPDGVGGAIIGWVDKRNGSDYNIYAQRVNSTGTVQWATNGVAICSAINNQSALDMKYIGSTGVMVSWKDDRTSVISIYAQLVSLSGVSQLAPDGIKISNALKSINPNSISDGNGGAIIAWQDSTSVGWEITSQKLNSTGTIMWASGGLTVSNATDDQINPSQVSDGNGGAIYAWEDHRNTTDYDIYAQHLNSNGNVGIHELSNLNTIQSICYPNPINSSSVIHLADNTLVKSWTISIYDSYGKIIQAQSLKANEDYKLNPSIFNNGTYFYVITLSDGSSVSKGSFISIK